MSTVELTCVRCGAELATYIDDLGALGVDACACGGDLSSAPAVLVVEPRKRLTPLQTMLMLTPLLAILPEPPRERPLVVPEPKELPRYPREEPTSVAVLREPDRYAAPRPPSAREVLANEKRARKAAKLRALSAKGAIRRAT